MTTSAHVPVSTSSETLIDSGGLTISAQLSKTTLSASTTNGAASTVVETKYVVKSAVAAPNNPNVLSKGDTAAIIISAIVFLLLVCLGGWFLWRRQRTRRRTGQAEEPTSQVREKPELPGGLASSLRRKFTGRQHEILTQRVGELEGRDKRPRVELEGDLAPIHELETGNR